MDCCFKIEDIIYLSLIGEIYVTSLSEVSFNYTYLCFFFCKHFEKAIFNGIVDLIKY